MYMAPEDGRHMWSPSPRSPAPGTPIASGMRTAVGVWTAPSTPRPAGPERARPDDRALARGPAGMSGRRRPRDGAGMTDASPMPPPAAEDLERMVTQVRAVVD